MNGIKIHRKADTTTRTASSEWCYLGENENKKEKSGKQKKINCDTNTNFEISSVL